MLSIDIVSAGKTAATITAVKISEEKGLAEYRVDKQIHIMGKVAAVIKCGTFKIFAETKGEELKQAIIDFVAEG
jgi:hypothetical protein